MTKSEYQAYISSLCPPSPIWKNCLWAFFVGGLICVLGQLVQGRYLSAGLARPDASAATSCTMVMLGALLTGLDLYDRLARYAGAGTIVPITGFANSIASPAMEFKSEGLVLGMGAKMFVVAGPVLVYGISSSVLYGLILLLFRRA